MLVFRYVAAVSIIFLRLRYCFFHRVGKIVTDVQVGAVGTLVQVLHVHTCVVRASMLCSMAWRVVHDNDFGWIQQWTNMMFKHRFPGRHVDLHILLHKRQNWTLAPGDTDGDHDSWAHPGSPWKPGLLRIQTNCIFFCQRPKIFENDKL